MELRAMGGGGSVGVALIGAAEMELRAGAGGGSMGAECTGAHGGALAGAVPPKLHIAAGHHEQRSPRSPPPPAAAVVTLILVSSFVPSTTLNLPQLTSICGQWRHLAAYGDLN
uniref:Uncharacterized protein n=1 Tax=Setaria italica TaxID=4555 RepID=K4AK68_SETIT